MKEFFRRNRKHLLKMVEDHSCIILFSNPKINYDASSAHRYRQNSDFFYLTGLQVPDLVLVLIKRGGNEGEYLFMEEPTEFRRRWESDVLEVGQAREVGGIETIYWMSEFDEFLKDNLPGIKNFYAYYFKGKPPVGLDFHNRRATSIKRNFPHLTKRKLAPLIHKLRLTKSQEEIQMIRTSIEITGKAYGKALKKLNQFQNERDLALFLEFEMKKEGASGFAFEPIIASGKNACVLHYSRNNQNLEKSNMILIDIGATFSNYHTDITRVIPYGGKLSTRQKEVYEAVKKVYFMAEKFIRPGLCIADINKFVSKAIETELLDLGLLTEKEILLQDSKSPVYRKYYMHGASHFLGLEVHDVGSRTTPLQKGMVITLEPGIYIEKEGIGVRLENDLLITESGIENLTSNIPLY